MFFMSEWMKERSSLEGFPFELLGHGRGGVSALRACAHVAVPLAVVQVCLPVGCCAVLCCCCVLRWCAFDSVVVLPLMYF